MAPIGIRYYKCANEGTGVIVYPQLRNASDQNLTIWDGSTVSGFAYCLTSGQEVIVDLAMLGLAENAGFLLGCTVLYGEEDWDSYDTFVYDPNSDLMAFGLKFGPFSGGGFEYGGVQPHNIEREVKVLEQKAKVCPNPVSHFLVPPVDPQYTGRISWPNAMAQAVRETLAAGIVAYLVYKGYRATVRIPYLIFFEFSPAPQAGDEPDDVPARVEQVWSDAIQEAVKAGAVDGGVTQNVLKTVGRDD